MEDQFTSDRFAGMKFQNILPAAWPYIREKQAATPDADTLALAALVLENRVIQDLYEIQLEDMDEPLTWEEFVYIIQSTKEFQENALTVLFRKLDASFPRFDCTKKAADIYRDRKDHSGQDLYEIGILSRQDGTMIMGILLYFAEQAHFNHLKDTVHPGYTWDEYCHDLQRDHELWLTALAIFLDAVKRMDFKQTWMEIGS